MKNIGHNLSKSLYSYTYLVVASPLSQDLLNILHVRSIPLFLPIKNRKKVIFFKKNMCVKPCVEPGRPVRWLQLLGRVLLDEVPLEVLPAVAQPEQGDGGVGEVVGQEPVVLDVEAVADGVPGDSYA